MDTSEYIVVAGGIAAIAFILWYFFGKREAVAAADVGGVQEIKITVKGGYSPDVVVVKAGRPVRLNFYRDETAACTEDVVIPEFRIAKHLPAFQTTPVEFTPEKAGEFTFACGMNMVRGKLVVDG